LFFKAEPKCLFFAGIGRGLPPFTLLPPPHPSALVLLHSSGTGTLQDLLFFSVLCDPLIITLLHGTLGWCGITIVDWFFAVPVFFWPVFGGFSLLVRFVFFFFVRWYLPPPSLAPFLDFVGQHPSFVFRFHYLPSLLLVGRLYLSLLIPSIYLSLFSPLSPDVVLYLFSS